MGSTGCTANSGRAEAGRFTGSMDDMAASAGFVPLASGVAEASCDRRLEGIPALAADGIPRGAIETGGGTATGRGCAGTGADCGTEGSDCAWLGGSATGDAAAVLPARFPAVGAV